MGVIDQADVIAWEHSDGHIYCGNCVDPEDNAKPLTENDFTAGKFVRCDNQDCPEPLILTT